MHFDVFNGDADGIFALHQLRLAAPKPDAQLVTGVKRDIALLQRPQFNDITGCSITVLDVSLDSNRTPLLSILERDNSITYIDHHSASPIPEDPLLDTCIDTSPEVCTSLLVHRLNTPSQNPWALCGAFGDNLHEPARQLAEQLSLAKGQVAQLREIGELYNYNGYGSSLQDLHFHPKDLYLAVQPFADPFEFFHECRELQELREGFASDMEQANSFTEHPSPGKNRVYILPDASWARRASGVFSNQQARQKPDAAHALITRNPDSTLRISVRAPLNDRRDAVVLCKQFGGGGREAAAGINSLPEDQLDTFFAAFNATYR